jgi:hypothetical protein
MWCLFCEPIFSVVDLDLPNTTLQVVLHGVFHLLICSSFFALLNFVWMPLMVMLILYHRAIASDIK